MNVHGFWNKANARNFKDKSVLKVNIEGMVKWPCGCIGYRVDYDERGCGEHGGGPESWRGHPDQAAVARALEAKCPLPEVKQ